MAISIKITGFMDTTSRNLTEIYHSWRWTFIFSKGCYVPEGGQITLQNIFSVNKLHFGWKRKSAI